MKDSSMAIRAVFLTALAALGIATEAQACQLNVRTTTATPYVPVSAPISVRVAVKNVGSSSCNNLRVIDYWMSLTALGAHWTEYTPSMLIVAPSANWKFVSSGFPVGSSILGGPPVPTGDIRRNPPAPIASWDPPHIYKGTNIGNAITSALNCAIAVSNINDYQSARVQLHKAVTAALLTFPPPSGYDVLAANINADLASKGIGNISCAGIHVY